MMDISEASLRALNPELDARNFEILTARARAYAARERPQVGDFARMPDGSVRRFTHDWGDGLQTTCGPAHPCHGDQRFYLTADGGASFSGSLDPIVANHRISATKDTLPGTYWFFKDNWFKAHNGITVTMPVRVFTVAAE